MGVEQVDPSTGLPPGTEILRNPSQTREDQDVGFPEESELIERHGKYFHLIGGSQRMAIEVIHFLERRKGLFKKRELVEQKTVYLLPEGIDLMEARKIGYRLLEEGKIGGGLDGD
ncbi:MAG: hypothetical protein QOG04_694 [Actinomycetota bacterium]|jgi:hypothetical protein|nr:hypothetical protein [Actinomycetota bacterium]